MEFIVSGSGDSVGGAGGARMGQRITTSARGFRNATYMGSAGREGIYVQNDRGRQATIPRSAVTGRRGG